MKELKLIVKNIFIVMITIGISFYYINQEINGHNYYIKIDSNEINKIIESEENTIIYFYKENCSPCSKFKITLNDYIKKHNVDVYAVNINNDKDGYFDLTDRYSLEYTPTVILFKNKKEIKRTEGLVTEQEFYKFMEKD